MNLNEWAYRWKIPAAALDDLRAQFGQIQTNPEAPKLDESETGTVNKIRLEASEKGARLFRNNNGACYDEKGNFIRYGLGNDSKKLNSVLKSSDLIGIKPVVITPEMVGSTMGQFLAREVKKPGWTYAGNKREQAQNNFIGLIKSLGGDAAFANSVGTI